MGRSGAVDQASHIADFLFVLWEMGLQRPLVLCRVSFSTVDGEKNYHLVCFSTLEKAEGRLASEKYS
jgi:hypothetical protein